MKPHRNHSFAVNLKHLSYARYAHHLKSATLLFLLILALALALTSCQKQQAHAQLDSYKEVEPMTFTNQKNEAVSTTDLKGKVWVASFVFTSCNTECSYLTYRLRRVLAKLADEKDFLMVSFTVDPQTDTPERLKTYAQRYGRDTPQWHFLTGDYKKMTRIVKNNFLLPIAGGEQKEKLLASNKLVHSNRYAVVDKQGVVRYYVDGMSPNAEAMILDAVRQLLKEPSAPSSPEKDKD
ncbi:MAG: SCO family protein [Verrucomicrobiales bacterium]|nr:SCO family protein [Verrucomicrobiales bacterium]